MTFLPEGPSGRRLGSAAWAGQDSVEATYEYRPGDIWLGRGRSGTPIGYGDDRHVCLVSGSRGGKGTTSIINNLCLWPGSVVVIDPKGEDATVTAPRRGRGTAWCEGMGQAVHVLDPFKAATVDEEYRSRFNPFDALDPDNPETIDESLRLADALVIVHEEVKDPFWDDSARSMVRALILHVLTAEQFSGRRNFGTLRRLLLRGDWEKVESLQRQGETDISSAQGLLWMSVAKNPAFDGLLSGLGDRFVDLMIAEPKVFESIRQNVDRNTEFLDSPGMQASLEASDFKLADLKTDPKGVSLFMCLPQRYMNTHHRWLRMMITLVITEMEIVRGRPASGHPVLMVLDEFAGLERLKVLENAVAQLAGHGVKLFFVLQTLEQLKAVYTKWETFLANSGLKIFFGNADYFTQQHVSQLIGETEVVRQVRSESTGSSEQQGSSEGRSMATGTSQTRGTGLSTARSESVTVGESTSTSNSSQSSAGGGTSTSWTPGLIGGRGNIQQSVSQNWSASHSFSSTKTKSTSLTRGITTTRSENESRGTSATETRNEGTSTSTSRSMSAGTAETVHHRPLIGPDEIGRLFARVDDPADGKYPGLALVLASGQFPIVVRRTNYFEDYQFIGLFSDHPDHTFAQQYLTTFDAERFRRLVAQLPALQWELLAIPGQVVASGQVLARAPWPDDPNAPVMDKMQSPPFIDVCAPVAGRIETRADQGSTPVATLEDNTTDRSPEARHTKSDQGDVAAVMAAAPILLHGLRTYEVSFGIHPLLSLDVCLARRKASREAREKAVRRVQEASEQFARQKREAAEQAAADANLEARAETIRKALADRLLFRFVMMVLAVLYALAVVVVGIFSGFSWGWAGHLALAVCLIGLFGFWMMRVDDYRQTPRHTLLEKYPGDVNWWS